MLSIIHCFTVSCNYCFLIGNHKIAFTSGVCNFDLDDQKHATRDEEDINEVNMTSKHTTYSGDPVSVSGSFEVKTRVGNTKINKSRYFTQTSQENTDERCIETNNSEGLTMKRKFTIVGDSFQKVSTIFSVHIL